MADFNLIMQNVGTFFKTAGVKIAEVWTKSVWVKVATVAVGVTAVGSVGVGVYFNQSNIVAQRALADAVQDLTKREEFAPFINMFKEGSLEFSVADIQKQGAPTALDFSASGKLYASKDVYAIQNLNVKTGDIDVKGNIYTSNELMYVQESNYLKGAYALENGKFAENFQNSIFAYGSESVYAIPDEDTYQALYDMLAMMDKINQSEVQKDAAAIYVQYYNELWNNINKEATITDEGKKVTLISEQYDCRVITVHITQEDMTAIGKNMVNYFGKDQKIVDFLEKYEGYFTYVFAAAEPDSDQSFIEWFKAERQEFVDNFNEEYEDKKYEGPEIKVEMALHGFGNKLAKLTAKVGEDQDWETFSLDFGADGVENSKNVVAKIGEGEDAMVAKYTVAETDSETKITVSTKMGVLTEDVWLTWTCNKSSKAFKMDVAELVTVEGKYEKNDTTKTVQINKITIPGGYDFGENQLIPDQVYTMNVKLVIKEKDTMPSKPTEYKTIANLTEEDINALMGSFTGGGLPSAPMV